MPRWAVVRAAMLALVIATQAIEAIPVSRPLTTKSLAKPDAAAEVDEWMQVVGRIGWSRDDFVDFLVLSSKALLDTRNLARGLTRPVAHTFGTGQGWALFASPSRTGERLEVWGYRPNQPPEVLYTKFDSQRDFLDGPLRWRRTRGVWDGMGTYRSVEFSNLAAWVATKAAAHDPDLTFIELRVVSSPSPPPGDTTPPKLEVKHTKRAPVERP